MAPAGRRCDGNDADARSILKRLRAAFAHDSVCRVSKLELSDDLGSFEVTRFEARESRRIALFSVGAGGNPERHLPLLAALAEHGFTVVAPHFVRLVTPTVNDDDLLLRARRLRLTLDAVAPPNASVVGIGHSIGATLLLALAGAQVWMRPGHRLLIERDARLKRLALLTPPTRFFEAPGALDDVRVPVLVWAGAMDDITPPDQSELLKRGLENRVPFELRVEQGAGHFSFMDVPPPNVIEPLENREAFLARLSTDIIRFVKS